MKKTFTAIAASSILSAALLSATSTVIAAPSKEKCADIVKEGKNACDANGHSCAGQSTYDNQPNEWIKVPTGTCTQIVSICKGDVDAPEGVSAKKMKRYCKKVAEQADDSVTGGRIVE